MSVYVSVGTSLYGERLTIRNTRLRNPRNGTITNLMIRDLKLRMLSLNALDQFCWFREREDHKQVLVGREGAIAVAHCRALE